MARSTIRDVARAAGVSTATVDRALNGRAGVSAANRQRVLMAAERLGYMPHAGMVVLPARPVALEFLMPLGRSSFMQELSDAITRFAASVPLVASCRITPLAGIGPEALVDALDRMPLDTSGVGLIAVDHPLVRDAVGRLSDAGVRIVTLASDIADTARSVHVGVDDEAAGRTAAHVMGLATRGSPGEVALFLGSEAFRGHGARAEGFRAVLKAGFGHLTILPSIETGEDADPARRAAAAVLRAHSDTVGFYVVGGGRAGIVEALREARGTRPFTVLHELTQSARGWLAEDLVDLVIDQDVRAVAEQAVIGLLGSIASPSLSPLLRLKPIEARLVFRENLPAPWTDWP